MEHIGSHLHLEELLIVKYTSQQCMLDSNIPSLVSALLLGMIEEKRKYLSFEITAKYRDKMFHPHLAFPGNGSLLYYIHSLFDTPKHLIQIQAVLFLFV